MITPVFCNLGEPSSKNYVGNYR